MSCLERCPQFRSVLIEGFPEVELEVVLCCSIETKRGETAMTKTDSLLQEVESVTTATPSCHGNLTFSVAGGRGAGGRVLSQTVPVL